MSRLDRITTDPEICHGQPTVRGLRYPVVTLPELLASGCRSTMSSRTIPISNVTTCSPHLSTGLSPSAEAGRFRSGRREVPRRRPATGQAGPRPVRCWTRRPAHHRAAADDHTTDAQIARQADAEDRVVVTKDADFRDGHLINGSPRRLLVVATGNISNAALLKLIEEHLDAVVAAFADADFVELRAGELSVHRRPGE